MAKNIDKSFNFENIIKIYMMETIQNHLSSRKPIKHQIFCIDRLIFSQLFKRGVRHFALQLVRGTSYFCLFFKILQLMKLPFQQAQNHKNPTAHYTAMLMTKYSETFRIKTQTIFINFLQIFNDDAFSKLCTSIAV